MKHYARFYGVPCYYNTANNEISGRNWICEKLLNWFAVPLSQFVEYATSVVFPDHEAEFPIRVGKPVPACEHCDGKEFRGTVYHRSWCKATKKAPRP